MVIYSGRTLLFASIFFSIVSLGAADPTISYDQLINKHSELWKRFNHKSPQEIIAVFFGTAKKVGDILITDVPGLKKGEKTNLLVTMNVENKLWHVSMCDANKNSVIEGNLLPEDNNSYAYLGLLRSTPQEGSGVLGISGKKRLISGTTALCLWDRFWELWGIKKGLLTDASMVDGFYLRILLPYVYGCSWYGGFGYLPCNIAYERYTEAVAFLANRTVKVLREDCKNISHAQKILDQALTCTGLNEWYTVGYVVSVLYTSWRYGRADATKPLLTPKERVVYKKTLHALYKTFLAEYPVDNQAVLDAQSLVNWHATLEKVA